MRLSPRWKRSQFVTDILNLCACEEGIVKDTYHLNDTRHRSRNEDDTTFKDYSDIGQGENGTSDVKFIAKQMLSKV